MRSRDSVAALTISIALCLALALAASGCYVPGGPVPESAKPGAPRAWTPEQVEQAVISTQESIYSPAPRDNGAPPPGCDYIQFLRFRPSDYSGNPADADAVLVLMPGFLCGANSFDYLGRQLVYMAKTQHGIDLEVWGTERRSNTVEDLTGLEAAEQQADTQVAIDYYFHGAQVGGRTFAGFPANEQIPYLAEFGLKLLMEDVNTIITTMLPDPEARRQKLFLGGHSLGGTLTALYAGWDFDGDPATLDDAGYRNCRGFVALDSVIKASAGAVAVSGALPDSIASAEPDEAEQAYAEFLAALRAGTAPRVLPIPGIGPETMLLLECLGMDADFAPGAESTLLRRIPASGQLDLLLRILHSRTLAHFLLPLPAITDFHFTNEAAMGIVLDDNFMPVTIIQASMGFLKGGPVVRKDFPLPADLAEFPQIVDLIGGMLSIKDMFIANDAGPSYVELGQGPLYSWANFDEVGDADDPEYRSLDGTLKYTSAENEVSDLHDVAKILYRGPSNLTEWYFTMRFIVDIGAATAPFGPSRGLNFLHADHVGDLPKIELLAGQGPMRSMFGIEPPPNEKIVGYNHIDVLSAAADRASRRPNEAFAAVLDFIVQNRVAAPATPAPAGHAIEELPTPVNAGSIRTAQPVVKKASSTKKTGPASGRR